MMKRTLPATMKVSSLKNGCLFFAAFVFLTKFLVPPSSSTVRHDSAVVVSTSPPPEPSHSWTAPFNTTVIAVAASNLPNGKVLLWSGEQTNHWGEIGYTVTSLWDPFNTTSTTTSPHGTMTLQPMHVNHHNMFCPGTTHLADGRIMVTGGMDNFKTTFYDPTFEQWTAGPNMHINRGYQAQTMLANGNVFVIGGSWLNEECQGNKHGEVWSAQTNTWRLLPGVPVDPFLTNDEEGVYRQDNHMWLFLAPNEDTNRIFHAGPSIQMHWISADGDGSVTPSLRRGSDDAMNGNAVMYDIGKLLIVGGAPNYDNGTALDTTFVIDINGPEAVVTETAPMSIRRSFANSIVLPNGEVVAMGGTELAKIFSDYLSVLYAELWSPVTQTWTKLDGAMQRPRNYHSTALLLKDGRIMSGGGGLCACEADHQDIEILTPPYLYEQRNSRSGALATRPQILYTVTTAAPGDTVDISMDTPDAGHTFALIKHSTYTHSTNNDQRRIPLEVVRRHPETSTFTVQIPANRNVVLAGMYFLFAMNGEGVPSIAEDFRIVVRE